MLVNSLDIERFGRKADLHVGDFSDRLNVIYGSNGSGKSTLIQFLRWMLYGNTDSATRRHLSPSSSETYGHQDKSYAAGSISFFENGNRRSLARQDDGTRYGRVALDGDSRYAQQSNHLVSLLGDFSQRDFDVLYAPDFESERGIAELLGGSLARGVDLTSHHLPSERVQELRLRIDNYRRDIDQLPWSSGDLAGLLDRKRAIDRRIETMHNEQRRRRLDYDREYEDITGRIQDLEIEVERLRAEWHARDEDVTVRRRELEEAYRSAEEAKREYVNRRRLELSEIENHLTRARSMQSELQRRYDNLESQLRATEVSLDRSPKDIEESVCLVQSMAKQLDDMRSMDLPLTAVDSSTTGFRSPYRQRGNALPAGASIELLRSEVSHLCDTLQKERTGDRVRAMADELDQLRQTDSTMQRWIGGLTVQLDAIAQEIEEAERHGVSLVIDDLNALHDRTAVADLDVLHPLRTGRLRAVQHSCHGYEPIDPDSDSLLIQLTRQRDAAQSDLQSAERQLGQLMERRRDLENALSRLSDRELEAARRELAEVEGFIRAAEERERLQREISLTEDELARLREVVRNSPVTEHATRILQRLTHGCCNGLRIDSTRNVSVQEAGGGMVSVGHLSRGVRDQVYLSFCLAIVTAFRRRGVQLPFILNDGFTNIDSENDDTLANVLGEFAQMGQQVLVFTRHQHVAHLLRQAGGTYLELGPRELAPQVAAVEPIPVYRAPEGIEQVRFRPRTDGEYPTTHPLTYRSDPVRNVEPSQQVPPSTPPAFRSDYARQRPETDASREYPEYRDGPGVSPREYRGVNPSPYENAAQPIRRSVRQGFENVTFENDEPDAYVQDAFVAGRPAESPWPSRPAAVPLTGSHVHPAYAATHATHTTTLSLGTAIELTETVDPDLASRLRAIGVVTVDDFLSVSAAAAEEQLRAWGLDARPVRRWQSQLALRSYLPGMLVTDARLLVACGINGLADLCDIAPTTLHQRIEHLFSTKAARDGGRYDDRQSYYDRDRVHQWIRSARAALGSWQKRRSSQTLRDSAREGDAPLGRSREPRRSETGNDRAARDADQDRSRRPSLGRTSDFGSENETTTGGSSRPSRSGKTGRNSRSNRSERVSRSSRGKRSERASNRSERSERKGREDAGRRRFHLNKHDAVVDAPTIGPRTALRLQKAGIKTVIDLLEADPEALAARVGYSRITAKVILEWQQQSILACRVPQMRGHDAQILVACGITDPDELASMDPQALWGKVKPFLRTAECKRIVRNGKQPDLAEIRDWVTWAQDARTLHVA